MSKIAKKLDIGIENDGTIFLFVPRSEAGADWLEQTEHESWQWVGGALAVEHGFAQELAFRALRDGLRVE